MWGWTNPSSKVVWLTIARRKTFCVLPGPKTLRGSALNPPVGWRFERALCYPLYAGNYQHPLIIRSSSSLWNCWWMWFLWIHPLNHYPHRKKKSQLDGELLVGCWLVVGWLLVGWTVKRWFSVGPASRAQVRHVLWRRLLREEKLLTLSGGLEGLESEGEEASTGYVYNCLYVYDIKLCIYIYDIYICIIYIIYIYTYNIYIWYIYM